MPPPRDRLDLVFQGEVRTWSRAHPRWCEALRPVEGTGGTALAQGERDGGLSLFLAGHGLHTACSDLRGPTERARTLHREQGVADRITYASIDTLAIPHV